MGEHHISHIEQILKALKESWEVIPLLQSGTSIYICMLQLCTLAKEAKDGLKVLDALLMDKLPEELIPEQVERWIDLIEARKSMPKRVWIGFSEPEVEQECAHLLNHFLPRTFRYSTSRYRQVTLFGEEEEVELPWEAADDDRNFTRCYEELANQIDQLLQSIYEKLNNPAEKALEDIYYTTRRWVADKEPFHTVRRKLKTFRFDYRTKPDYQQRLEQWVVQLSNDIQNHWYSPEWIYFFPQNEMGEYVVNRIEVGRLLYRRRERFKVEEKYLIHFLCLLEQWSFLQNELVKVQKSARPAAPTAPQPAPAPATAESNPNLLKGLSEKLLSCDQALAKLKLLLVAIDPQMNTSNGQHDQKRRWSHLYKAWLEDGFVRDNITDADFGHLIHSLLPTRSSKSVYSTLYRDKEKMGNSDFQIIVQLIRAHFQPVADLMKAHHG